MIFITGKNGQLGTELIARLQEEKIKYVAYDKKDLDITDKKKLQEAILKNKSTLVINCAAYTAVDKAESEADLADDINHKSVEEIARICKENGIFLIHISTDFVFYDLPCVDGRSRPKPITPETPTSPFGAYSETKDRGEKKLFRIFGENLSGACIIRTSWLYSIHGKNFIKTILKLAEEREELFVVEDQIGRPCWSARLAEFILKVIVKNNIPDNLSFGGIYHFSNRGIASWYDFAHAIVAMGTEFGLLKNAASLQPISTAQYPTPAPRPGYSVLDLSKAQEIMEIPHWRDDLRIMLTKLSENHNQR